MSNRKIHDLLKKTEHYDADERYMATNDLIKELNKLDSIEKSLQAPIRKAILKQLEDKGADVSTIAVKALETLVLKFNNEQIVVIVDNMGQMLVDPSKSSSRDIYSAGLVTVLGACDEDLGKTIAPKLLININAGLNPKTATEEATTELASMAVLVELLRKFGGECTSSLSTILQSLLKLLTHTYESARMQASQTLGPLTPFLDGDNFKNLMEQMINQIKSAKDPGVYINCIVVISKHAALRVADYLDRLIPILLDFCKNEASDLDETTVLWSNCLEAFNSLIQRCPNKISPYIKDIIDRSLELLTYDPNFVFDGDEKMGDGEEDEDEGDEDWGDDDDDDVGWGDDGDDNKDDGGWGADDEIPDASADESWKIRKSAIRVISTFITVRSDILKSYVESLTTVLLSRFTERDSSVQEQVYQAFRELLHEASDTGNLATEVDDDAPPPMGLPTLSRQRSFYDTIICQIPTAIAKLSPVFPKSSVNTQKAIYGVLAEIAATIKSQMSDHFDLIMPHILFGLKATGKAEVLNEDAILLTQQIFKYNDVADLQKYIVDIADASISTVNEAQILVKSKALLLCGYVARVIDSTVDDWENTVQKLHDVTFGQLEEKATNQSIKISSINAMALILASHGDFLDKKCKGSLKILQARLGNSVTQVAALQAFSRIANSDVKVDLTLVVSKSIPEISGFLRQVSSKLKHEAMICLDALVRTHGGKISTKDYAIILSTVEPHIGDGDLQLAGEGLVLMSSILVVAPAATGQIAKEILPKAIEFVKCPLLHGNALQSLIKFFQHCVEYGGKEKALRFENLLEALRRCVSESLARPGYSSVAQCIAGITEKTSDKLKSSTVKKFMNEFSSKSSSEQTKQLALLSIGEIGHELDLSGFGSVFKDLISAFDDQKAAVREAASFALGNVAVGNMTKFMPDLMKKIESDSGHEYLLLSSLKENIISHQKKIQVFKPHVTAVMGICVKRAESKDEGIRKVTAECLGRLSVIDHSVVIPKLEEISVSPKAQIRAVAATALRFSLQGAQIGGGIGFEIGMRLDAFLKMLQDEDLEVKREAVLTSRTFCISKEVSINRDHLKNHILPALYAENKAHPDLIHEMDYGNFKVIVDDGLPLRKAVYQTLDAILDTSSHLVDMKAFNEAMKVGLADGDYDVQIMTYQSYQKLAKSHPGVLLEMLDAFPSLILSSVKGHIKVAKSKEPLRAVECLRVIVGVMLTFNTIKGVELCPRYQKFFKQVCRTKLLQEILKELQS